MINRVNDLNKDIANQLLKNFNCSIDDYSNNPFSHILLCDDKGVIVYTKIYDRIEIEYIIVSDKYQKQGIGSKLLNYVIDSNKDIENITLEVKLDNQKAISFYKKNQFKEVAIREKYYGNKDALLMIRKFDNNEK